MIKEEALAHYKSYFSPNSPDEQQLCIDTIELLERARKASDIAAIVGKLYGTSGINSRIVKTGAFIGSLIGIATNVAGGTSPNNVRDHIKNVLSRDNWEKREKQDREQKERDRKRFTIQGKTVTVNCAITFDLDKFALFQSIVHQLDAVLSQVEISHFDGDPHTACPIYQISGTAPAIAGILRRVRDEIGTDALTDIRYTSETACFERAHLTLLQTLQLADYEQQI